MKRLFAVLSFVLIMGLAACGGGAAETTPADTPAPPTPTPAAEAQAPAEAAPTDAEPVELTVALFNFTTQPEFENTLNAWTAMNPHVTFDIIDTTSANFPEVLTTQLAGGRAIDLMYIVNLPLHATLAEAGQLMDLTDFVNGLGRNTEFGAALDMIRTPDNRFFSVPWRQDFWPLFYNKDIFEAAGEPLPYNLTWDEYRDLAIRLTSGEGIDKVYGSHLHTWNSIVQAMAGAQLDEFMIQDDYGWLEYIYQIRMDMQDAGAIMDLGTIIAGSVGYRPRFEMENAAMIVMGSWYIGELAERAEFNWGIAPVPQMPGATEIRTMGGVTPIAIGANANHPEEALRFLEWVSGEGGALVLAEVGIPSAFMNDAVMDRFFSMPGMPTDDLSRRAFNPDFVRAEFPQHPLSGIVDSILLEEHQLIFVGDHSIEEGLRRMGERVGRELAQQ